MSRKAQEPAAAWMHRPLLRLAAATLGLGAITGCATIQEIAALQQVNFAFDRITDVRLAGVSAEGRGSYSDLRGDEIARIATAIAMREVPIELIVHLRAENPTSNGTTARLHHLDWTMFLDDRELVKGLMNEAYTFEPGREVDVPLRVRFDALKLYEGGAADLFEFALALAGAPGRRKEVRLDLVPTIDTSMGPIRYPGPITVRHTTGS